MPLVRWSDFLDDCGSPWASSATPSHNESRPEWSVMFSSAFSDGLVANCSPAPCIASFVLSLFLFAIENTPIRIELYLRWTMVLKYSSCPAWCRYEPYWSTCGPICVVCAILGDWPSTGRVIVQVACNIWPTCLVCSVCPIFRMPFGAKSRWQSFLSGAWYFIGQFV